MSGACWQQQQEQDELSLYLWSSLNNLRGHISAEVFQAAERELGFNDRRKLNERKEDERKENWFGFAAGAIPASSNQQNVQKHKEG
jgi:hypothetical protein